MEPYWNTFIVIHLLLFSLYSTLMLVEYTPFDSLSMAANFTISIFSFFLLFIAFTDLSEIYGKLHSGLQFYMKIASVLLLWHIFFQVHGFFAYAMRSPYDIGDTLYGMQLFFTSAAIVFSLVPSLVVALKLRKGGVYKKECASLRFISGMSELIGEVSLTLFRRALEEYNRENHLSLSLDVERGLDDEEREREVLTYVVNYFERYVGPVSRMVYGRSLDPEP